MTALETLQQAGIDHRLVLVVGRDRPGGANRLAADAQNLMAHQLDNFVTNQLPAEGAFLPLYQALAGLPAQFWLTTCYGDTLVQALTGAGAIPNQHRADADWHARQPGRPDLVWLRGRPGLAGRLVVVEEDYDGLPDAGRVQLFARARQWLAGRVALFVGCDPTLGSDFSRHIYPAILGNMRLAGGGILLWPNPQPADVDRWVGRGITLVDTEPLPFVTELAGRLAGVTRLDPEVAALKGLATRLQGSPTAAAVRTAVDAIPAAERPNRVIISFTLDVAAGDQLAFTLDVKYRPDIGIDYDPKNLAPTGVGLDELTDWARETEKLRNNGLAPDVAASQALFDRLLLEGGQHRAKYQQALLLARLLPAEPTLVLNLADRQGRLWPIPWELLHDGHLPGLEAGAGGQDYLCLHFPTYRWLPAATSVAQATGGLERALVIAADPKQTLTSLDGEVAELVTDLAAIGITLDQIQPDDPILADPAQVAAQLGRSGATGYDLLHFAGHGQFDEFDPLLSALILGRRAERELGILLTAQALREAAGDSRRLKLVIFSACQVGQGGAQDELQPWEVAGVVTGMVQAGLPAAIGMQWNIEDSASRQLITAIYDHLLDNGRSLEKSLQLARRQLFHADRVDWANPILVKKHDQPF